MAVWRLRVEVRDGQWEGGSEEATPTPPNHYFRGSPHRQASWGHQKPSQGPHHDKKATRTLHRSGSESHAAGYHSYKRKRGASQQDTVNRKAQVIAAAEHLEANQQQDNTQGGVWKLFCDEAGLCRMGSKYGITNAPKPRRINRSSECDEKEGLACISKNQPSFQGQNRENSLIGRQLADPRVTERPREWKMEGGSGSADGAYRVHKKRDHLRNFSSGFQRNNTSNTLLSSESAGVRTLYTLFVGSRDHSREGITSAVSTHEESSSKHSVSSGHNTNFRVPREILRHPANFQQNYRGCDAVRGYVLGSSASGGEDRVHVVETVVTVVVKDINDNAPVFPNTTMVGQVQENVAAGE